MARTLKRRYKNRKTVTLKKKGRKRRGGTKEGKEAKEGKEGKEIKTKKRRSKPKLVIVENLVENLSKNFSEKIDKDIKISEEDTVQKMPSTRLNEPFIDLMDKLSNIMMKQGEPFRARA